MKKALALKWEEDETEFPEKLMEKINIIQGYKLLFLDEGQSSHQVEVRKINFRDLMRHLQEGQSVFITPKLQKDFSVTMREHEKQTPWYFAHS